VALGDDAPVPTTDKTPALGDASLPPTSPAIKIPETVKPITRFQHDKSFRDQVDEAERDIILGALAFTRDNATEAARLLDLERGHFYKKMKSLGLKRAGGETTSSSE
jgi:two-component system, NtrC family, nitrogen regulation response regulator NtrX